LQTKQVGQLSQANRTAASISYGKNIHVSPKSVHLSLLKIGDFAPTGAG